VVRYYVRHNDVIVSMTSAQWDKYLLSRLRGEDAGPENFGRRCDGIHDHEEVDRDRADTLLRTSESGARL
jgi:hypothetical protein